MSKIKNSKYKNTAILFELLIRQVTNDVIAGNDSPAVNIIKKYFSKTELAKEHKLYQSLINNKNLSEIKANSVIDNIILLSKRLNRSTIRREKYNLIKEIKENYDLDSFCKNKINNYPQYAAAYTLIEAHNSVDFVNPDNITGNKNTLLEHICSKDIKKEEVESYIIDAIK